MSKIIRIFLTLSLPIVLVYLLISMVKIVYFKPTLYYPMTYFFADTKSSKEKTQATTAAKAPSTQEKVSDWIKNFRPSNPFQSQGLPKPANRLPAQAKSTPIKEAFENKDNNNIHILLAGTSLSTRLYDELDKIKNKFNVLFPHKNVVFTLWQEDSLGPLEILNRLKKLQEFPQIFVFLGHSYQTQYKYDLKDLEAIWNNIKIFEQPFQQSILYFFPFYSRFIYEDINYVAFKKKRDKIPENKSLTLLKVKMVNSKLYQFEWSLLLDFLLEKTTFPILITSPLDLNPTPQNICAHAKLDDPESLEQFEDIQKKYENEDFKSIISALKRLISIYPGNALTYHMLGISLIQSGDKKEGLNYLMYARSLDCQLRDDDPVANQILKKLQTKYSISLIDFFQLIQDNSLKLDDKFEDQESVIPAQKYFEVLAEQIASLVPFKN